MRKFSTITPTIVETEYTPLDESFYIESNGATEQWYYENEDKYAPNRRITPLLLTPKLTAKDQDTGTVYNSITFTSIAWIVSEYNPLTQQYEDTTVTNTNTDYVLLANGVLQVNKNISYSHAVTIRCKVEYNDPRVESYQYGVEDSVLLTTNMDADVVLPEVAIISPHAQAFNPLTDWERNSDGSFKLTDGAYTQLSEYEVEGRIINNPVSTGANATDVAAYRADGWGTEQLLPDNSEEVTTVAPELSIYYSDQTTESGQKFMFRKTGNGQHLDAGKRVITWNQMIQDGNFPDGTDKWTVFQDCTPTYANNTLTLTSNKDTRTKYVRQNITFITGHVYYFTAIISTSNSGKTVGMSICTDTSEYYSSITTQSTTPVRLSNIAVATDACYRVCLRLSVSMPVNDYATFQNAMLIDLTRIYGVGREPATAAQFEADYEKWFGHALTYEAYTAGETRVVSDEAPSYIESVKGNSVVWNQLLQNGNFSDGTNGWSNSASTISVSNNVISAYSATGAAYFGFRVNISTNGAVIKDHKYYYSVFASASTEIVSHNPYYDGSIFQSLTRTSSTVTLNTNWTQIVGIGLAKATDNSYIGVRMASGTALGYEATIYAKNFIMLDLTQMFGAGNEPSTVADFEAWLAANVGKRDYYPHDPGTLISANTTSIKTVGFNQFDNSTLELGKYIDASTGEITTQYSTRRASTVYFPCLPSTAYRMKIDFEGSSSASIEMVVYFYDSEKNYISYYYFATATATSRNITSPENARYFRCASNQSSGNLYFSFRPNDSRDSVYEPYWSRTAGLDITSITGHAVGSSITETVFPDGMKRVNDVYDEIKVEDGKLKAIKRVGSVDLGDLSWSYSSSEYGGYATSTGGNATYIGGIKTVANGSVGNIMAEGYVAASRDTMIAAGFDQHTVGVNTSGTILVSLPSAQDTGSKIKTYLNGVKCYFELATPVVYELDPVQDFGNYVWYAMENNTETLLDTLPYYKEGQGTRKVKVDAMFGENINLVLRCTKNVASDELSPSKAYASVTWKVPDIDAETTCKNGGAVRSDTTGNYTFSNIINVLGQTLPDAIAHTHLRYNWKLRKDNTTTITDKGWGTYATNSDENVCTIAVSDLKNARSGSVLPSSLVNSEVYLLGAWKKKTGSETGSYEKPEFTDDEGTTYIRTID